MDTVFTSCTIFHFQKTSRFGIGVGFGYTHFSIRHDGMLNVQPPLNSSSKEFTRLEAQLTEDRWINKTVFNNLEIPFEFRIRSQKERPKFKFLSWVLKLAILLENTINGK